MLTKKHSAPAATSLIVSCRGELGEQNGGVHSTNRGDFKQQIGGDFIQEIRGSKYATTRPRESRPSIMESLLLGRDLRTSAVMIRIMIIMMVMMLERCSKRTDAVIKRQVKIVSTMLFISTSLLTNL